MQILNAAARRARGGDDSFLGASRPRLYNTQNDHVTCDIIFIHAYDTTCVRVVRYVVHTLYIMHVEREPVKSSKVITTIAPTSVAVMVPKISSTERVHFSLARARVYDRVCVQVTTMHTRVCDVRVFVFIIIIIIITVEAVPATGKTVGETRKLENLYGRGKTR